MLSVTFLSALSISLDEFIKRLFSRQSSTLHFEFENLFYQWRAEAQNNETNSFQTDNSFMLYIVAEDYVKK